MSANNASITIPHASAALSEADRLMTICNSCRYCEGLCAVFPSMELHRVFADGDLEHLANLCHNCGACYDDCQFSPPHEFEVNVPATLAAVRNDSYARHAWPPFLAGTFERNGLILAIGVALSVSAFLIAMTASSGLESLTTPQIGPGAFYRYLPHNTLALLFGIAFGYALLAMAMGVRSFWLASGEPGAAGNFRSLWQAVSDASRLRYLDGGGGGCNRPGEEKPDSRKYFHHLTFYGFILCFAATSIATFYHYILGLEAPYAWYDLPVLIGSLGGFGLVIGPVGLLAAKLAQPSELRDRSNLGMEIAFIVMLWLAGMTGMGLLIFRGSAAMGILLAVHLGVIFTLFVTMPYGKFVHGLYRFAALVRYAAESSRAN